MSEADLDATFAALADPTRRGVVDLLRRRPQRAGELAAAFEMSAPAMSRHLRVLRKTGLVEEEGLDDDARVRVYRLRPERFAAIRDWLDEVEGYWSDQLAAFKAHAERGKRRGAAAKAPARRRNQS
jgi:DNA-binding transcriptional ArsR family regulator